MSKRVAIMAAALGTTLLGVAVLVWATARRDQQVSRAPITSESIVMLGDSITEQGPWETTFTGLMVANQGYSGFTTAQLLDVAREIAASRPRAVYVLTGTNDIRDGHPPAWTVQHLGAILDEFATSTPETTVVIQTIMPRERGAAEAMATNAAIARLAADRNIEVFDVHAAFDNGAGGLRPEDTADGIHLSDTGNRRWADLLQVEFARRWN